MDFTVLLREILEFILLIGIALIFKAYDKPLNFQLAPGWILQFIAFGIGVRWCDVLNVAGILF